MKKRFAYFNFSDASSDNPNPGYYTFVIITNVCSQMKCHDEADKRYFGNLREITFYEMLPTCSKAKCVICGQEC